MPKAHFSIVVAMLLGGLSILGAQVATITGVVLDEANNPLADVHIRAEGVGTYSDADGFYVLQITADRETTITFSHLGHKNIVLENLILTTHETYEFNPVMKTEVLQVDEVTVTPTGERGVAGITSIAPSVIRRIPGANAGVENVLKLLPGVSSNNELSTQYAVRGGNYDENLVYVNGIEVYRPFLVRSAQQEGLSFVNSDLAQKVHFSAGGFQAKYGDKLSSVLDITYKKPVAFGLQLEASLLGASASVETVSKSKAFSSLTGIRYRNNGLLVNSQQTNTQFKPVFADVQTYLTHRFSTQFQLSFLGNISLNDYRNKPLNRQTNFGTLADPKALVVAYEGREHSRYETAFGALKADYIPNTRTVLTFITSLYHTTEEEYSDIIAQYRLGGVNTDLSGDALGEVSAPRGLGSQLNRARNDLDALIAHVAHRGRTIFGDGTLDWGLKYTREDIRDQLRESEFLDSLGFQVRPPLPPYQNQQPEEPFEAPLVPYQGVQARNFVKTDRLSGFLQYGRQTRWGSSDIYFNVGTRAHYWYVRDAQNTGAAHIVISPRAQLSVKPDWDVDMVFRLSGGLYHQPPFYRELRDSSATVRPEVKAQRALHAVLGNEYSFTLWERPFTFSSEVYYKRLDHVNPYTLEDVRIRYAARNTADAYVYGMDLRLHGAFVPGTESWFSMGLLKTAENIGGRGYIARPTDQRLKLGILFQDYIPDIPRMRMYLNLVYGTGVPGGSPSYADPYDYQGRLRDYKRADLGISHIFVGPGDTYPRNHWLHDFKELSLGFEIFNLFNNQNSITNTWVRDVESKQQFAVPNFMTSRVLNLKLRTRF